MHIEMLTAVPAGCGITGEFAFLLNACISQGLIREAELVGMTEKEVYYRDLMLMQLWELVKQLVCDCCLCF